MLNLNGIILLYIIIFRTKELRLNWFNWYNSLLLKIKYISQFKLRLGPYKSVPLVSIYFINTYFVMHFIMAILLKRTI